MPDAGTAGNYAGIVIGVSDGEFITDLPAFSITVSTPAPDNAPPVISGTPPQMITEGLAYRFTPSASDPDSDMLSFSISGQPAWTSFDPSSGTLSGTPGPGTAGRYDNVVIGVTDGEFRRTLPSFSITVAAPAPINRRPTISGTPPPSVEAGRGYSFRPTATDPDGDNLTFTISNRPPWATFDARTGTLSGTPAIGDERIYGNIVIGVSDGELSASLRAFAIEVISSGAGQGSITLSWQAPTLNEDGSALVDLAGYRIYWGTSPGTYTDSVTVENPGITTYTVDGLAPGDYTFVATSFNAAGVESSFSNPATQTVK